MPAKATSTTAQPSDIWDALWQFGENPPHLHKSASNPHFKNSYVPLEQVVDRVIPRLRELGVQVFQPVDHVGEAPALTTILRHQPSGTSVEATAPLIMDRLAPQAQGSAITYMRRYSLLSILGLVGDKDDDGETTRSPSAAQRGAEAGAGISF